MKRFQLLICVGIILIFSQVSQAQYLLNLSDKDCVELSLDMIRKGVQQEDTAIVLEVIGENVLVQGVNVKGKNLISQNINQIFSNSSKRVIVKGDKAIMKTNTGRNNSNLWDFDILSPRITIVGDTAIVECELVLWQADSGDITKIGSKTTERLVFWSPFKGQMEKTASNNPLRWKLVGCNDIFDFLDNYGVKSVEIDNSSGVKR